MSFFFLSFIKFYFRAAPSLVIDQNIKLCSFASHGLWHQHSSAFLSLGGTHHDDVTDRMNKLGRGESVAGSRAGGQGERKGQRSREVCWSRCVTHSLKATFTGRRLEASKPLSAVTPPSSPLKLPSEQLSNDRHTFRYKTVVTITRSRKIFIAK